MSTENIEWYKRQYFANMHAMQSGVKMQLQRDLQGTGVLDDASEGSPKHLRVGVNSALIDASVVAKLCMDKGIFTEEEYYRTLAEFSAAEKLKYEQQLSKLFGGANIKLV